MTARIPGLPRLPRIPQVERLPRLPRVPRRVARAPVPLYLRGLGLLLGQRLVAVEYRARISGRLRQVVLEVAERGPRRITVVSGHGPKAAWFRDITAEPRVRLTTGGLRDLPAEGRPLAVEETIAALTRLRTEHPDAAAALAGAFDAPELAADGPLGRALAARLPMMEFTPRAQP